MTDKEKIDYVTDGKVDIVAKQAMEDESAPFVIRQHTPYRAIGGADTVEAAWASAWAWYCYVRQADSREAFGMSAEMTTRFDVLMAYLNGKGNLV